jgi:REP-associated tyrosine transposase
MPRRPRLNLAGLPQHIVQRGNNRQPCFYAEDDYRFYLHWLRLGAERYECEIHAYVLMTNHVHVLATPRSPNAVSRLMQSIGRRYVQYVNRFYRRSGTLWEGRFKASLVNAEEYLLLCYRYIELNPVRAGMAQDPGDYVWSSYRWHGLGEANALIKDHALYMALGPNKSSRQQAYRALFRAQLDDAALTEIRQSTQQGLPLGGERFREEVATVLGRRLGQERRGRPEGGAVGVLPGQTDFGFE